MAIMESGKSLSHQGGLEASRARLTRLGRAAEAVHLVGILPLGLSHKAAITTDVVNPTDRSRLTRMKGLASMLEAAAIPAGILTGNLLIGLGTYGAGKLLGATTEIMARRRLPASAHP